MLLVCDGPSAPSPSLFCADVIVFFGTTPASFTVVLCIFLVSSSVNARFLWWPDLGMASSDQWDCRASHERQSHIAPPHPLNLDQSPTFNLSCFHYLLLPDVHTCVSTSVTNTFMCTLYTVYVCMRICAQTFSVFLAVPA